MDGGKDKMPKKTERKKAEHIAKYFALINFTYFLWLEKVLRIERVTAQI